MKNKSLIFLIFLVFMIVLSAGFVSAKDTNDTISTIDDEEAVLGDSQQIQGTVSGDVDIKTENPWNRSGELSYDIPSEAKTIKSADVYVNVYSGSAKNTHGAEAKISLITDNNVTNYTETLWIPEGSADGTVYPVNNHTTKCYSDYMIHYNVTSMLQDLNGTNFKVTVDTIKYQNKTFDGRIKLIGIVLAYDDGDEDVINYLIDDNQIWTDSNKTIVFNTSAYNHVIQATLTNVALSSSDGTYRINGNFMTDTKKHVSGDYYQFNQWDITGVFKDGQNTEFNVLPGPGYSGPSYKSVLSVLTTVSRDISSDVSLTTERKNNGLDIVYAGTFNELTITAITNWSANYIIQLLADGVVINSTEVSLVDGISTPVTLIDNKIRPINETTVSTGSATGPYTKVNYTVQLLINNKVLSESSIDAGVVYNGYLSKDFSYPGNDFTSFLNITVSGDIVVNVTGAYASGSANRTDKWDVSLPSNSSFVKAFVYAAFCYGNIYGPDLFNVTFNGAAPSVVSFIRDQANIFSNTGYGLIVYDVTDLIKEGENTFTLNKTYGSGGAYPSTLIYLYNTTGSKVVKNVYISNGADLVGVTGNGANRPISVDSTLNVDASNVESAVVYIFGAGAKDDRATIVVNGESDANAWNTTLSDQLNVYTKDISKTVKNSNDVSIILNNGMFTTLQQIVVITQKEEPQPVPPAPVVKVSTKLTVPKVKKVFNVNKKIVITLKDAKGKAVVNAKLTVTLNGKTKEIRTNSKGQATYTFANNLIPKTYTLKVSYAGDSTHIKSSASSKVIIKKASVKLAAKKKSFKVKVKVKKYTVTLKNNKGKAIKKVKLTLKIKGKKAITAKTNSKGKATFKIKTLKKKGNFSAKVIFKGNKYYNKKTKSVKITVKK